MERVFDHLPKGQGFQYFQQKYDNDPALIGSAISELVFEWAWSGGSNIFPTEFFEKPVSRDIFFKYLACSIISDASASAEPQSTKIKSELESLSKVRPHAIITTNYDNFLEGVFEGYEMLSLSVV